MAEENPSCLKVDLSNKPVRIPLDVENCKSAHGIRGRKYLPHAYETLPTRLLSYPKPNIQSLANVCVFLRRLKKLPSTYDVQAEPRLH